VKTKLFEPKEAHEYKKHELIVVPVHRVQVLQYKRNTS